MTIREWGWGWRNMNSYPELSFRAQPYRARNLLLYWPKQIPHWLTPVRNDNV